MINNKNHLNYYLFKNNYIEQPHFTNFNVKIAKIIFFVYVGTLLEKFK